MQKFTIKVPVYQFDCVVIIDEDIDSVINKYLKRYKMPLLGEGEQLHGFAMNIGVMNKYFIFYSLHSLTPNIIAHEISHLVDYVFEDRTVNQPDTEIRAFLLGHIIDKVFDYVLKHNILISKWLHSKQQNPEKQKLPKKLLTQPLLKPIQEESSSQQDSSSSTS